MRSTLNYRLSSYGTGQVLLCITPASAAGNPLPVCGYPRLRNGASPENLGPHMEVRPLQRTRARFRIFLPALLAVCGCAYVQPGMDSNERKPAEPFYEDSHVLEIAWQLRDVSVQAAREAEANEARPAPAFEPLGFTTSMGLRWIYSVVPSDGLYHHEILLQGPEERLTDAVALNLLHFAADLLGVVVPDALRDAPGQYRLVFDVDAPGAARMVENSLTALDQDDILQMWREAVLSQVSARPMEIRSVKR
jgi:hypothetical protein